MIRNILQNKNMCDILFYLYFIFIQKEFFLESPVKNNHYIDTFI